MQNIRNQMERILGKLNNSVRIFRRWRWNSKLEREKKRLVNNIDIIPNAYRKIIALYYPDAYIRRFFLNEMGVCFGKDSFSNIGFSKMPMSFSKNKVFIGENVSIAPNVLCICETAANNGKEINSYQYVSEKATRSGDIYIEDDVWIGANVTILPGIRVGKCAIIGSGSVVTKDLDPYGVYVGIPARKIRDIRN